jgi:DNA-binding NarL/FixJ family response regulator
MNEVPIKILLVDDHQMVLGGMRMVFRDQQEVTVVGAASNGAEALEKVKEFEPDVVVMDMHLCLESGIEVTRQILQHNQHTKVIVLSADGDVKLVREAIQAGALGYILKDGSPEELKRAIKAVMDNRLYLCPNVAALVMTDYLRTWNGKVDPSIPPVPKCLIRGRERALLKLVADGKRNKDIASILRISLKSVETYRARLMKKLGCSSSNELIRYAIREDLADG